jgi:CHAD domain-containing protein
MNRWERRIKRKLKSIANKYALLSRDPDQQHESIHRARRLTKQLRAMVALLPTRFQRSVRKTLRHQREIARQLGLRRDESLFRQNLRLIAADRETPSTIDENAVTTFGLETQPFDIHPLLNQLVANVAIIQQSLQDYDHPIKRQHVAGQWRRACKLFLKRTDQLLLDHSLERWHALRKSVRQLEYQMRFLRRHSHHAASPLADLISDIGKRLGRLNDYAKMKEAMIEQKSPMGHFIKFDEAHRKQWLTEIERGCNQEMKVALPLIQEAVPLFQNLIALKSRELIE